MLLEIFYLQNQTSVSAEISTTRYAFTRITSELFHVASLLLSLSTWDASLENLYSVPQLFHF